MHIQHKINSEKSFARGWYDEQKNTVAQKLLKTVVARDQDSIHKKFEVNAKRDQEERFEAKNICGNNF